MSTPSAEARQVEQYAARLYLRLWLAVVGAVAVLALLVGWAWRVTAEISAENNPPPAPREVVVRNDAGDVIGSARALPGRMPGQGLEFEVQMENDLTRGQTMHLFLPPRQNRSGGMGPRPGGPPGASWYRAPFGFFWMLGLVAVAVALATYPIVRRLTKRLEVLRQGVEQWGQGDLTVRVPVMGNDEVAFLATRFNAAAQRIEELLKSHKSLLANASHELRSPLTRIRMGLELMGGSGVAQAPAFHQEILRNIAELDQLVDEILLASRLDVREADVGDFEEVDLTGLVAEECARVGAVLDAGAASVHGSSKLLRRLVRNLLENARRYGAGEVNVELSANGSEAELRVKDRGPGVPASQRERIFEPFYRLPGASERDGGVGLGLALVKSIAVRHGGSVRCEDHAGGGACFIVTLPALAG